MTQYPRHLAYNRLPLLADSVFDYTYTGFESAQHAYPMKPTIVAGDVLFIKTDILSNELVRSIFEKLEVPIILVTGVSDMSPTETQFEWITSNPNIRRWIGTNILQSHPKVVKIPIGMSEPGKPNSIHHELVRLHAERIPWERKFSGFCAPHHAKSHSDGGGPIPFANVNNPVQSFARANVQTLPQMSFYDYMKTISSYQFVVCMPGFGVDCHRVCEALLMGSVPILLHTGLDDMYSQFPCLLVDSFESIDTSTFVWDEAKYQQFLNMFWLKPAFWQPFIDEAEQLKRFAKV
jgi:hypothetical protein